jgi:16S rRNA (guanine(1405)-N(7))-methyltransferase
MNLAKNTKYLGIDIDKEEIEFLNKAFKISRLSYFKAKLGDILTDESPKADVIFLLKLLPLLERQQKNISLSILKKLKARFLVVSFPTKTLGGRQKNMVDFYSNWFQDLVRNQTWKIEKIVFPPELVFVIKK